MLVTLITGDQTQDMDFLSEVEFNNFFGETVITGTLFQQDTEVLKTFKNYFISSEIITAGPGVTVSTGTGTIELTATSSDIFKGHIVQLEFLSSSPDKWMVLAGENHRSNQAPYVFPFPARIVATSFTNRYSGVNVDFEFYKSTAGSGDASTLIGTWDVNNARVARKSDYATAGPAISFDAGDKLAVFASKAGGKSAKQPALIVYFQILEDVLEEDVENFSGNFSPGEDDDDDDDDDDDKKKKKKDDDDDDDDDD